MSHHRPARNHLARCVLALVGCCTLAASAHADTELRWKFKVGEKNRYEFKMEVVQAMKAGGAPLEMKIHQTMDMTWEVKEVNDDGSATLNQTVDRIRMEMALPQPGQPPIKYDSQAEKKAPGTEALAKAFDALVGKPFVMKVSSLGEVTEFKAPEGLLNALKNPGQQGGMLSEDGLKQMISQSILPFPAEAVAVDKTWERSSEAQTPPFGKQSTTTVYKYAGESELEGAKVDKIDVTIDMKFEQGDKPQAKITLKDNKAGGAIFWDNVNGKPLESKIETKMTFEISAGGMTIEQDVNTTMLMKLVKGSGEREL